MNVIRNSLEIFSTCQRLIPNLEEHRASLRGIYDSLAVLVVHFLDNFINVFSNVTFYGYISVLA